MIRLKRLALLGALAILPGRLLAQKAAQKLTVKSQASGNFVFPMSPQTHLISYRDTIRVVGASAEAMLARFADAYRRNFVYADYNLRNPSDTTHQLRPRQQAALGETVITGTSRMAQPGKESVFVVGITPPEALRHAPPLRYLHFTLRFRAEAGIGYLTITDLYQRSTTMQKEVERQYGVALNSAPGQPPTLAPARTLPPSTPVEALYWDWLPPASRAVLKQRQPATEPVPTVADARLVASTAQQVISAVRFAMERR